MLQRTLLVLSWILAVASSAPAQLPEPASARPAAPWQRSLSPEQVVGGTLRLQAALSPTAGASGAFGRFDTTTLSVESLQVQRSEKARLPRPRRPEARGPCALLTDLTYGWRDRFGGTIRVSGAADGKLVQWPDGSRGARIQALPAGNTPGRVTLQWLQQRDDEPVDSYLDVRQLPSLWIRARGTLGKIRVTVRSGPSQQRVQLGSLDRFLDPGTAASGWRQIRIPLTGRPQFQPRLATALELQMPPDPDAWLEIDRLALCRADAAGRGGLPEPAHVLAPSTAAGARPFVHGLWVWSTRQLLEQSEPVGRLLGLLKREGFNRVYLQLPGAFAASGPDPALQDALAGLIASLAAAGADTYALDGAPTMARPAQHESVRRRLANLLAYNRTVPAPGRFAGLQLDIEPYLLPEYASGDRQQVLDQYLRLLESVHRQAQAASLPLEVAMPFWFDAVGLETPAGDTFRYQPLSEAVIDRVDSVALMDYRTTAQGSNGTLALAEHELAYAAEARRRVVVALETTHLPDQLNLHFRGAGSLGLPQGKSEWGWILAAEDAHGLLFWWFPGPGAPVRLEQRLRARHVRPGTARWWRVSHIVTVPSARITFADLDAEALHRVLRETTVGASRFRSFAGTAVHHFDSLLRLPALRSR